MMDGVSRNWMAVFGLFASLGMPTLAQDPPPDVEGLQEVEVDLTSGVLKSVLPFDTPFLLTGTPPPRVSSIDGVWCDISETGSEELTELVNSPGRLSECPENQPPDHISKVPRPLTGWNDNPDANNKERKFYLFIGDRLDADHTFVFQFSLRRQLEGTDLTNLENQVKTALDDEFQRLEANEPTSLSRDDFAPLEAKIRTILEAQPVRPGEVMVPAPSSIFDPADKQPAEPPWIHEFQRVFNIQLNRRNAIASLNARSIPELLERLSVIRQNATLKTVNVAVQALTAEQLTAIATLLPADVITALDTLVGSGDPNGIRLANIAMAIEPLGGSLTPSNRDLTQTTLSDQWREGEVDDYLANATVNRQILDRLERFVRVAGQLTPLQSALQNLEGPLMLLAAEIREAANAAIGVEAGLQRLAARLADRTAAITALAAYLRREAELQVSLVASSRGGFTTRARAHISMDLGVMYAGRIGEIRPYMAANFYTRPVNRNVPLSEVGGFRRRFSVMMGITVTSIEEKDGERILRDDAFGSNALLVGVGYRLTDAARVSGGILFFKENDPNPLIDNLSTTAEGFVAVSFDWNVKNILDKLGTAIGGS